MGIKVNGWSWDPTEDGGNGAWVAKTGPSTWTILKDSDINNPPSFRPTAR